MTSNKCHPEYKTKKLVRDSNPDPPPMNESFSHQNFGQNLAEGDEKNVKQSQEEERGQLSDCNNLAAANSPPVMQAHPPSPL